MVSASGSVYIVEGVFGGLSRLRLDDTLWCWGRMGSDGVVDDALEVRVVGQWANAPVNISRDLERCRRG